MTGTILYYLLWPLVWFYAPLRVRIRTIVLCGDKVLAVKNWFGPNSWQLPGGGAKIGEKPSQTAVRELKEELGLNFDVKSANELTAEPMVISKKGLLMRYHYVLFRIDKKPEISASKEIDEFNWVSLDSFSIPEAILRKI